MGHLGIYLFALVLISASWLQIDAQSYVYHFNCNNPQGLFYISNPVWTSTASCSGANLLLPDSEASSTCVQNYIAHINSQLGTMSTVYTDLNGAVSCYPRVDPCPSTGTVVMCRNTLPAASNATTNPRCPEDLQISNGKVLYPSGNIFPSQSFDTCNQGYYISGFRLAECSTAGTWGNRVATCTGYNCPQPTLANGLITGTAPLYTASCNSGYLLSGSINVTCLTANTNTPLPTCIEQCPVLAISDATYDTTTRVVGTTVTVSCASGFGVMGSATVTCMAGGSWSTLPTCVEACPALNIAQAIYSSTTRTIGTTVAVSCNPGYQLLGLSTVNCMAGRIWTQLPTCEDIVCSTLPTITNGVAAPISTARYGVATVQCMAGYTLSGSLTTTCLPNGSWALPIGTCNAITCPVPTIPDGMATPVVASVPQQYTISCSSGFTLVGSNTVTCPTANAFTTFPICQANTCPALPVITNGYVSATVASFTIGGTASVLCLPGYVVTGTATITCGSGGQWPSGTSLPTCTLRMCPALTPPISGSIVSSTRLPYGVTIFACNDGYQLTGNSATVCMANGAWSTTTPTCTSIMCSSQAAPSNGAIASMSLEVNGVTIFTCNSGYNVVGSSASVCLPNGTWSTSEPTCQPIQCPANPVSPMNGAVSAVGRNAFAIRTYSCSTGYQLSGATTTVCQTTGAWSGTPPTCTRVVCSGQVAPSNGAIASMSLEINGATIFTCNAGYNVVGSSASVCLPNGTWSTSPPTCQLIQCPVNPVSPTNGAVSSGARDAFTNRTYSCSMGYQLSGTTTTVCQTTGTWSGTPPTCTRVMCSGQVAPSNGAIASMSLEINGATIFTCNSGYNVIGSSASVCLPTGTWSTSPPTCQLIQCPVNPVSPINGAVSSGARDAFTNRTYSCNTGYQLSGTTTTVCQTTGAWSGSPPACTRVMCSSQVAPSNGVIASMSLEINGATIFTCNSGYNIVGSSASVCLPTGTWSTSPPTCKRIQCPDNPVSPTNGAVSAGGRNAFAIRTYSCSTGYQLSGATTTVCQTTEAWSGTPPTCTRVLCSSQVAPLNGAIASMSMEINGATIFTCNSGYNLAGSSASVCLPSGNWSTSPPTCQGIQCPMTVPTPANGAIVTGTNDVFISRQYTCNSGYQLQGSSNTICLSTGDWSTPTPTCKRVECPILNAPTNGVISPGDSEVFTLRRFTCNTGFNLVGNSASVCLSGGTWSNVTPQCVGIQCSGPLANPTNGRVNTSTISVFSVSTYSCNSGYELVGETNSICLSTGQWSGPAPTCSSINCNSLPSILNGNVQPGRAPLIRGSTAFVSCNEGFALSGMSTITCQSDLTWSTAPTCSQIRCLAPLIPPMNGNISNGDNVFFSIREYSCSPGYELQGAKSTACQTNGDWSVSPPTCNEITCNSIPATPNNGFLTTGVTTLGSILVFGCDAGFELAGTNGVTVCQADKTWSLTSVTCARRACPSPPNITNAVVMANPTKSYVYGDSVFVQCNTGHSGSGNINCTSAGTWTELSCSASNCGSLGDPVNGMVFMSGDTFDSTASYTCSAGYNLNGFSSATCTHSGMWSPPAPRCDRVNCGPLSNPTNGRVVAARTDFESTATYTCSVGFVLSGQSATNCLLNGSWSSPPPTCQPRPCPSPPTIDNGVVMSASSASYAYGDSVFVQCSMGHSGNGNITCLADGGWSMLNCSASVCGSVSKPTNGGVFTTGTTYGATASFSCDVGYNLKGSSSINCPENGTWSATPSCDRVTCAVLMNPMYGTVRAAANDYLAKANYSCNTGYVLSGDSVPTCLLTGEWSSQPPTCQPRPCPGPPNTNNGVVMSDPSASYAYGDSVYVQCNTGHSGSDNITCTADGTWSTLTCSASDCGAIQAPANGMFFTNGTTYGSMASFTCNIGYNLTGSSSITCYESGVWSASFPSCDRVVCSALMNPTLGTVRVPANEYLSKATYSCNDGYVLSGDAVTTCLLTGLWSTSPPTCQRIPTCAVLTIANGEFSEQQTQRLNAVANVTCNEGYEINGSRSVVCLESGKWSDTPHCMEIPTCAVLQIANGAFSEAQTQRVNSAAEVTCNTGYQINGSRSVVCLESGVWSDNPHCMANPTTAPVTEAAWLEQSNSLIVIIVVGVLGILLLFFIIAFIIVRRGASGHKGEITFNNHQAEESYQMDVQNSTTTSTFTQKTDSAADMYAVPEKAPKKPAPQVSDEGITYAAVEFSADRKPTISVSPKVDDNTTYSDVTFLRKTAT
ncbi:sushi, von Willebrand factor type A, EGF and pentraxin domain-containing protein 1-like isoform X2 [Sycon ciliatum]|uniref:sushi, von Willebrand factor type A, EGF and pentraxin domain-containing protein 1-like isoform X2 n=1 Tax=Sycon ciliatum TaxID=27933 RepID=UPI0031F690CA